MPIPPASLVAPRTDASDAGLRAAVVQDCSENALRRRAIDGEEAIRRPDLLAYRCDLRSPEVNEVSYAGFPDGDTADTRIAEVLDWFGDRPMFWWVGPDSTPADLSQRLERHGAAFLEDIPGMAMELAALPSLEASPGPHDLRVEPVLDDRAIEAFHDVLVQGFPDDFVGVEASQINAAAARTSIEMNFREPIGVPTRWIGWVGDRAVTSTRIHAGAGVAGVYGVVTVPSARRRGYGEAIIRTALQAARDAGLRIATLQASNEGRGVYERIGFREVARYRLHAWQPGASR